MPTPRILKERGCTPKAWKALFTAPEPDRDPRIKKLLKLIQSRIYDGRSYNMRNWRTFHAIDLAFDTPFAQTTPTLINNLMSKNLTDAEIMSELEAWGLRKDELFLRVELPNGQYGWTLNPPMFYKVLVPIVLSYVKIRWGSLFNERNQDPLLPFEPMHATGETRALCEVLTSIVQQITKDYGYANDLKQEILQMLQYGICLVFPREVWHCEYQLQEGEKKGAPPEEVITKEGIRYFAPHPTRMFWDMKYSPSTFNTDTGCSFAGYWTVRPYSDILDNKLFWNRTKISHGTNWMEPALSNQFFQQAYPCQLKFPEPASTGTKNSREELSSYYASDERDKGVFLTDLFMKLNPKQWGMGDYDYDLWVRFVVASDADVVYAEPCCYSPTLYYGYDADQLKAQPSSLALECIPWQDAVGNVLSQILLTCKQNLANINFYDKNIIDPDNVKKIENAGERNLRGINMIPMDSIKNARIAVDPKNAIHSVTLSRHDVMPLFNALNTTISLMERMLQISSQETGSQASHQQSAEELRQLSGSSNNRVAFTGSFIDDAIDARKRQLHEAAVAYMDDEVIAYVPADIDNIRQTLKKLGFDVEEPDLPDREGKLKVTGSKKKLRINGIAKTSQAPKKTGDAQTAQVMMQAVQAVANNQLLAQAVGPTPLIQVIEQAAILAGADYDFRLKPEGNLLLQQIQQLSQQIMQQTVQQVEKDVTAPVARDMAKLQQEVEQLQQAMAKLLQMSGFTPQPSPQVPPNVNDQSAPPVPGATSQPPSPPVVQPVG